jgi:hypothetical protein
MFYHKIAHLKNPSFFLVIALSVGLAYHSKLISPAKDKGYPFEQWDEIGSSNNATVLAEPETLRVYSYGSLDTLIHLSSHFYYKQFDHVGRRTLRHSYSNNVLESIEDPFLPHKPRSWDGLDYNYFRGLGDRKPVFIAREIYFCLVYTLVVALTIAIVFCYRSNPLPIILGFSLFLGSTLFVEQSALALPNAVNSLLALSVCICIERALSNRNSNYLLVAAGIFACALNFKIDALLLGPPIVLAFAVTALREVSSRPDRMVGSLRLACLSALKCCVVFGAVLIATKPSLIYRPIAEFQLQWRTLHPLTSSTTPTDGNWKILLNYIKNALSIPQNFCGPWALGIATIMTLSYRLRATKKSPSIPSKSHLIAYGIVILSAAWLILVPTFTATQTVYLRYFLSGSAVATFALGLTMQQFSVATRGIVRGVSYVIFLLAALFSISNLQNIYQEAASAEKARAALRGLEPYHNRNKAAFELVQQIRRGKLSRTVLVDQHAYFDLRFLLERNLDVRYINIFNYERVLSDITMKRSPDLRPIGIMFVNADGGWSGVPGQRFLNYFATIMSTLDPSPPSPGVNVQIVKVRPGVSLDKD